MARVYERTFDWDEAKQRRLAGESVRDLAAEYGVSTTMVYYAINPKTYARARAYTTNWQRQGECPDCGAQTTRTGSRVHRCPDCSAKRKVKVRNGKAYCPTCDHWKLLKEFSPSNKSKHRLVHTECRACQTKRRRANRWANIERERAYWRDRYHGRKTKAAA
jgi:DNA-directed RNA polymerase subunit RPC12/RpoP